jgi:hypothetical protein
MNSIVSRHFLLAMSVLLLALVPFASVQAIGIELKPVRFEKTVSPGDTFEVPLKILNKGITFTASFEAATFTYSDDSGTPKIVTPENRQPSKDIQDWISLPGSVEVEENQEVEVSYTVTVPEDAAPGGHYGTVFVLQELGKNDEGAVGMVAKVGSLIILKVEGDIVEQVELTDFGISDEKDNPNDVAFGINIKNTGNVHVTPYGRIEVKDGEGNIVKGIDAEPVFDGKGVQTGVRAVDYIRFNPDKKIVLPGQTRNFNVVWQKAPEADYTAQFTMKYDGANEEIVSNELVFNSQQTAEQVKTSQAKGSYTKVYGAIALIIMLCFIGIVVKKK